MSNPFQDDDNRPSPLDGLEDRWDDDIVTGREQGPDFEPDFDDDPDLFDPQPRPTTLRKSAPPSESPEREREPARVVEPETVSKTPDDEGSDEPAPRDRDDGPKSEPRQVKTGDSEPERKEDKKSEPAADQKPESSSKPTVDSARSKRLVECPDCGHMVSKLAQTCPSCGRPMRIKHGVFFNVFFGTISLLLTVVFIHVFVYEFETRYPLQYEYVRTFLGLDRVDANPLPIPVSSSRGGSASVRAVAVAPSAVESELAAADVAEFNRQLALADGPDGGDMVAQFRVGYSYDTGKGVKADAFKAHGYYLKAAFKGHAEAQSNLAVLYVRGEGVDQNYQKAAEWFERAANQGMPFAQYNLGTLYDAGNGVKQDHKEAFRWYYQAAEAGLPEAQFNVAYMLSHDEGADLDFEQALKWAIVASESGHDQARTLVDALSKEGDFVKDAAGIERARKEAADFLARSKDGN